MQRESSPARGGKDGSPSAHVGETEGIGLTSSLYSAIFPPRPNLFGSSVSVTPGSGDEDNSTPNPSPLIITSQDLDLAYSPQTRLVLEHQDLLDRHHLCLAHLHETAKQAEALRRENTNLRLANRDLNKRLGLLIQASLHKRFAPSDFSSLSVLDDLRRLSVGENAAGGGGSTTNNRASWAVADANRDRESPKSVIEGDRIERLDVERVTLPKSISVRSSGYLKNTVNVNTTPTAGATSAAAANGSNRVSSTRPRTASPVTGTKVYVRGGTQEEDALELEVYNQGMFKTELCNKWQETGACPYGDHCQFAHGIKELRPVIRHPRYKTEVCRMILAGDHCPYGHRCHFRHALSEEEKFMVPHYSVESKVNP